MTWADSGGTEMSLKGTMLRPSVGISFWGRLLLLLVLLVASECRLAQACPELVSSGCSCTDERPKGHSTQGARKRVSCAGKELTETPEVSLLPNRTVSLNLSNNRIRVLRNGTFAGLHSLDKLDLRNNLISAVMPGAFQSLTALRKLDLSNNRIGCLTPDIFQGLTNLTKLNISGNIFSSLEPNIFQELPSLKLVNFDSEFLSCDCSLRWVPGFFRTSSARLGEETLCAYPRKFQNRQLRELRESDLSCEGPLELHTLSLLPSLRQVVFKGDRLPFHCTAALVDKRTTLHWRHKGQAVANDPDSGVLLEENVLHDCTFVTSELILTDVHVEASGEWECMVSTGRGNTSRSVEIVVLENSATFCPEQRVTNNRGEFRWPRTLGGITSYQYCLQLRYPSMPVGGGVEQKKASRYCDRSGRWEEGDYSQCLYTNDITNVLHTFILMPINASNAVTLAHQVRSYTLEAAGFTDTVDVLYVAQMMQKFMDYVKQQHELSEVLVEMGSNLMQVDDQILSRAQREERACSSVVHSLESLAWPQLHPHAQYLSMMSRNIVIEAHLIRPAHFTGMSCTAFQRRESSGISSGLDVMDSSNEQQLRFRCTTGTHNTSLNSFPLKNAIALASVSLPPSLFPPSAPTDCKLQFVAFRTGRFFPFIGNSSSSASDHTRRRSVNTPVIYVGLDGCIMWNQSAPIIVSLRHTSPGSDPVAAHWRLQALKHHGSWSLDGCQLAHSDSSTSTLHCSVLSNYAVLQEVPNFPGLSPVPVEVLHPVVYTCTAILLLCLFTIIFTYILHHSSIRISRKSWHTLLNTCFHIAMTTAVFAGGITLTSYPVVCQAVGIVLHYSSLSTLLWIGVSARVLYKEALWQSPRQPEGEASVPPIQRPMLRFYLIAGGVPLIICGITAAVNISNYGDSIPYCWLIWQPSIGAFYVPAGLVIMVTWIYFLCTVARLSCRNSQRVKEPSCSGSGSTPLPENQPALSGSASLLTTDFTVGPVHSGVGPEDHHSLKAQFFMLLLTQFVFVLMWCCAAMAMWHTDWERKLFSCLYGVTATGLGIVLVFHHCYKRLDIQAAWLSCCPGYHRSQPIPVYSGPCTVTSGAQSISERGSQLFAGSPPTLPETNNYCSSARSSSTPSGTGSTSGGPCKLTNLLQVTQDNAHNGSRGTAGASTNTSTSTENNSSSKPVNNALPTTNATTPVQQPQRRKAGGRTKAGSAQYHHRGECRGHYRLKALRGGGGGGSVGALGPPGTEQMHHLHRPVSSENGSLRNSHSESQNGPLTNGRHRGEGLATSPSEGSDGGSSGGRKPFPLLPSVASRVAMQQNAQRRSASRDNLKMAATVDRDSRRSSFPSNVAMATVIGTTSSPAAGTPNGTLKGSTIQLDTSGTDQSQSSVGMRGGVWKSETTV